MNYKITCPNKKYNGESASINFVNGVGYTDSEYLVGWFRSHGYIVEEVKNDEKEVTTTKTDNNGSKVDDETSLDISKLKKEELVKLCEENGIPIVKEDTKETLKEKLKSLNIENDKTEDDVNE